MENKKNLIILSKTCLFLEGIIPIVLIILLASFEKLGRIIVFIPWGFLLLLILSILGLILAFILKSNNYKEKLSTGSFDLQQISPFNLLLLSSRLMYFSIGGLIFGLIGFLFFINFFYFSSF